MPYKKRQWEIHGNTDFSTYERKLKGPLKNILQINAVSEMHSKIETRWDIGRETMIKTALCMWNSTKISVL